MKASVSRALLVALTATMAFTGPAVASTITPSPPEAAAGHTITGDLTGHGIIYQAGNGHSVTGVSTNVAVGRSDESAASDLVCIKSWSNLLTTELQQSGITGSWSPNNPPQGILPAGASTTTACAADATFSYNGGQYKVQVVNGGLDVLGGSSTFTENSDGTYSVVFDD
ncbi:hypothetical protein [Streptomyces sp. NPDC086023]|uniref:hypothetical protein n=1 Tax=Streptomyces sp. NPDC086023 TaxID=3365746 RepID=UPI0037D91EB2